MRFKKLKTFIALASLATSPFLPAYFGAVDLPTREIVGEIVGRRRADSKTWLRDDGYAFSAFSLVPVHYRGADGNWTDIENTFTFDGFTRFKNKNTFEISVPNVFTNGHAGKIGGKQIAFVPIGANAVSPIIADGDLNTMTQKYDKNRAYYENAWTGTDVEYKARWNGLKEFIIIKDATAPTTFRFRLDHDFAPPIYNATAKRMMKFQDGKNIIELDNITAKDAKGRNVPIIKDWNLPQTLLTLSYNPILEVTSTTTIVVAYPIVIDPTSYFNIEGATEVTSFDAWIDLCFTASQSRLNHRLNSANCTTTVNNDSGSLAGSEGYTGHVPPRATGGRAWLHWNTATTITSGATISNEASTSIGLYLIGTACCANSDNDGEDYIGIIQATTSPSTPLVVSLSVGVPGDWIRITGLQSEGQNLASSSQLDLAADGDNKGHDITTMANGEARNFRLNATGRANIAISGGTYATTTFGIAEGHDMSNQDIAVVGDTNSFAFFDSTETADLPGVPGPLHFPVLHVVWTAAAAAVVPPPADVIFFSNKPIILTWIEKLFNIAYAYGK